MPSPRSLGPHEDGHRSQCWWRDVWFWHLNGIETERATEDLDISMEFQDWKGFDAFVKVLLGLGFAQPVADHPEKFIDPDTRQKMDLLPCGILAGMETAAPG